MLQDEQNTTDVIAAYGPSVVAVNVEVRGQRVDPFGQGFSPTASRPSFGVFFNCRSHKTTSKATSKTTSASSGSKARAAVLW